MKILLVALLAGLGFAPAALADPIEGWWKSPMPPTRSGVVWMEVEPWGPILAGTLRYLPSGVDANGLWRDPMDRYPDLEPGDAFPVSVRIKPGKASGDYTADLWTGSSWEKTSLRLKGESLIFEGCATTAPLCRETIWTRH